jgi:hypothetical protein
MISRGLRIGLAAGVLLAAGAAAFAAFGGGDPAGNTLAPVIEPAQRGEQCIADPAYMRRHHMEMLNHQRDGTVRQGIRSAGASLQACVNCHASERTGGSVAKAPTGFCVSCHLYAAVKTDCFDCHASTPSAAKALATLKGARP